MDKTVSEIARLFKPEGVDAGLELALAIDARIGYLIGDTIPYSLRFRPVRNGADYRSRLRATRMARNLDAIAVLLGVKSRFCGSTSDEIESAERFLEFQRELYFCSLEKTHGKEHRDHQEQELDKKLVAEGFNEYVRKRVQPLHPENLLRPPTKPWELKPDQRHATRLHSLGGSYERYAGDECSNGQELRAWEWEVHSWDCPACNSSLMARVSTDSYATRDTDPVACPVCGDHSVYIRSSHVPEVECLLRGDRKATAEEVQELLD
jgi:rubrerythrin